MPFAESGIRLHPDAAFYFTGYKLLLPAKVKAPLAVGVKAIFQAWAGQVGQPNLVQQHVVPIDFSLKPFLASTAEFHAPDYNTNVLNWQGYKVASGREEIEARDRNRGFSETYVVTDIPHPTSTDSPFRTPHSALCKSAIKPTYVRSHCPGPRREGPGHGAGWAGGYPGFLEPLWGCRAG
jgi:hypothetical protein